MTSLPRGKGALSLRVVFLLVATIFGGTGCNETRFASDLAGDNGACARDLEGYWRVEDDNASDADYVAVDAQCRASVVGKRRDAGREEVRVIAFSPRLVTIGGKLYLTLGDDDFHRIGDSTDTPPDAAARGHAIEDAGYHYFRIDAAKNRLRLYGVDHEAVARSIIAGDLDGDVHKDDEQLQNTVRGDADAMAKLVRERWLFQHRHPLLLTRVTVDDVPAPLRAALARGHAP